MAGLAESPVSSIVRAQQAEPKWDLKLKEVITLLQKFLCCGEQSWDDTLAALFLCSTCTASPAHLLHSLLSVLQILSQLSSPGTPAPMRLHSAQLPGAHHTAPSKTTLRAAEFTLEAQWLRAWCYRFTAAVSLTQINPTRYKRCGWPFAENNYIKLAEHPSILNSYRGLTPHSSPAQEAFAICKILPLTPLPSWLKYNFICLNAREEADPTCFSGPRKPQGAVGGKAMHRAGCTALGEPKATSFHMQSNRGVRAERWQKC